MKPVSFNLYCKDIVEIMHEALLVVDEDGYIQMVNRAMEEMSGYSRDELVGSQCTIFNCDACKVLRKTNSDYWCVLFEKKQILRRKCHIMRKDGAYVTVLKTASILNDDDGNALGSVEIMTDISELDILDTKVQQLTRMLDRDTVFHGMVGHSDKMKKIFNLIDKAAQSDFPVFICGESGTGKELVARAIHELGSRAGQPYVQVNCAALSESLLESELFGHIKGAFTGALQHRKGRFEIAHKGDIFLDEIGDLPMSVQVKLLRVLENKTFERVGESRSISVDVRLITATNKYLPALIGQDRFREDLFYRINVIPIHLPALRERKEDIPHLVDFFLKRLAQDGQSRIKGLSPQAMKIFMDYTWPGNVRELKSALEYSHVIADDDLIKPEHLPGNLTCNAVPQSSGTCPGKPAEKDQKNELIEALRQAGGNKSQAARILGINRVTVLNRMRKYGIDLKKDIIF